MKINIKNIKTLLLCLFMMTSISPVYATDEVKSLIQKASQTRLQAKKLGYEWTATEGLIQSAREALAAGKIELAQQLATAALKQAENGIKQAKYADAHWQEYLPD